MVKKKFTDKQKKILDVAEELIATKGFDATSVRDICGKANINVAMISYYFGSKEKMMNFLYQYRVQRSKESFSEFTETIKEGKAEMQMKEIINYIVSLLFKYNYFHGFVTQEIRVNDFIKDELLDFYKICVVRFEEIVKKGIISGVFTNAPKSEDILTNIIGSTLFVIRNKNFYELYLPSATENNYLAEAEKKVKSNLLQTTFALLGFELYG